ncbi:unnamed protein product [Closterium sp. NIES-65]|nr:unnamed protein product [Closterium sp. NIES-65]
MSFAVRLIIDRVFNAGKLGHSLGCFSICSVIPDHICFFSSGCVDQIQQMADKNHPNIVKLLGFAIGGDLRTRPEQVLIYEYVPNGDLHRWIGPSNLCFVIHALPLTLYHPSSTTLPLSLILYTSSATCLLPLVPCHSSSAIHPLPLMLCQSFGVLMLVVLTGREPISETAGESWKITPWVAECLSKNDVGSLMDPTMDAPAEAVLRVAQISLACTGERTADRPSMVQVANELQAIREAVGGKEVLCAAVKVDAQVQEMKDVVAGVASLDTEIMKIGEQASG